MNKLKFYCEKTKKNYKKMIISFSSICLIIFIICILLGITYSFSIAFFSIPIIIFYGFVYYIYLIQQYNKITSEKEIAFYSFYRNILSYLENNETLYSSLNLEKEYVDPILYDDVIILLEQIQQDTSLQPFLTFSDNFKNEMIKQMILLLYQSQESGVLVDVLESVNTTLTQINYKTIEAYIEGEKKQIDKYHIYPLVLSAAIIIIFSIYSLITLGGNLIV